MPGPAPAGPPSPVRFTVLLGALTAFGPLSIDMYLPAMPSLAASLATTPSRVQLTLSAFVLGFGAGQLVYGPLADRWGRKPPLLGGLALYVLASVLCAFPHMAGTASALAGTVQFGLGAVSVAALGALHDGTAFPRAAVIALAGLASLFTHRLLVRR